MCPLRLSKGITPLAGATALDSPSSHSTPCSDKHWKKKIARNVWLGMIKEDRLHYPEWLTKSYYTGPVLVTATSIRALRLHCAGRLIAQGSFSPLGHSAMQPLAIEISKTWFILINWPKPGWLEPPLSSHVFISCSQVKCFVLFFLVYTRTRCIFPEAWCQEWRTINTQDTNDTEHGLYGLYKL